MLKTATTATLAALAAAGAGAGAGAGAITRSPDIHREIVHTPFGPPSFNHAQASGRSNTGASNTSVNSSGSANNLTKSARILAETVGDAAEEAAGEAAAERDRKERKEQERDERIRRAAAEVGATAPPLPVAPREGSGGHLVGGKRRRKPKAQSRKRRVAKKSKKSKKTRKV